MMNWKPHAPPWQQVPSNDSEKIKIVVSVKQNRTEQRPFVYKSRRKASNGRFKEKQRGRRRGKAQEEKLKGGRDPAVSSDFFHFPGQRS